MNRRWIGVALAMVACAMGSWTSGALSAGGEKARAHNQEFETTITIKQTPSFVYKGKVISDSDDCVKNRRVTLFAKEAGSDAVFVIGHDRSDEKGKWSYQVIGDGYYAEAKERVVKRGDHKHTCLFDRSPTTPSNR